MASTYCKICPSYLLWSFHWHECVANRKLPPFRSRPAKKSRSNAPRFVWPFAISISQYKCFMTIAMHHFMYHKMQSTVYFTGLVCTDSCAETSESRDKSTVPHGEKCQGSTPGSEKSLALHLKPFIPTRRQRLAKNYGVLWQRTAERGDWAIAGTSSQ